MYLPRLRKNEYQFHQLHKSKRVTTWMAIQAAD